MYIVYCALCYNIVYCTCPHPWAKFPPIMHNTSPPLPPLLQTTQICYLSLVLSQSTVSSFLSCNLTHYHAFFCIQPSIFPKSYSIVHPPFNPAKILQSVSLFLHPFPAQFCKLTTHFCPPCVSWCHLGISSSLSMSCSCYRLFSFVSPLQLNVGSYTDPLQELVQTSTSRLL